MELIKKKHGKESRENDWGAQHNDNNPSNQSIKHT